MVTKKDVRLNCMTIIDPATGWFKILEVPCFDLDKVSRGNSEYIDKSSTSVIHMFNHKWLFRYPRPCEVVFDNSYEFKQYINKILKDFSITPICTSVWNTSCHSRYDWGTHELVGGWTIGDKCGLSHWESGRYCNVIKIWFISVKDLLLYSLTIFLLVNTVVSWI